MKFAPESPPLGIDPALGAYLGRLEQRIQAAIEGIHVLEKRHVEPSRLLEGSIEYADGTNWQPSGTAEEGIYAYYGGTWKKLG